MTNHAAERAARYAIPYTDIADVLLLEHSTRQRNRRSADWVVRRGALVIAYNWPDGRDTTAARVVTLWVEE